MRDKKRRQRAKNAEEEGPKKRGPKVKIGLKDMTPEEKRRYEAMRKANYRLKKMQEKKGNASDVDIDIDVDEEETSLRTDDAAVEEIIVDEIIDKDDEAELRLEATAILNIVEKKKDRVYYWKSVVDGKLSRFSDLEKLDVLVLLCQSLDREMKISLEEKGLKIDTLPKKKKRTYFSAMSKSTKHRYKDEILATFQKAKKRVFAATILQLFQAISSSWKNNQTVLTETCGISFSKHIIPANVQVEAGISRVNLENIGNLKHDNTPTKSKILKIGLLDKSLEHVDLEKRGVTHQVASQFKISHNAAKRLVIGTLKKKPIGEKATRAKRTDILKTEWPDRIHEFCLTKPICREVPGETVSVSYGEREEKYIKQFSDSEIFSFFCIKYPDFRYKLNTFRKMIPKNFVSPTLRDVKQNTCPLHENVRRSIKALNRFLKKNKSKELMLPTSSIDMCLEMICNPTPDNSDVNRNPLNWNPVCTKFNCANCGGTNWFWQLKRNVCEKGLNDMLITYSHWITEKEGDKRKQILKQDKSKVEDFLQNILWPALGPFPEHLRKAWCQWQITKHPLVVISENPNDVAVRTREDFQEDLKFLCTSETVATHRGVGVITMVCFPVVIEIFKNDGTMEMHGLIIMSDSKSKNFDVVKYFELKCLEYVRKLGFHVVRMDRITDGCSSQFWCYSSYKHLETMPEEEDIDLMNQHRLERYEGKSLSDALGSLLKRRMRNSALQNRIFGCRDEYMLHMLGEIEEDTDLDDLVFNDKMGAYEWLVQCMRKPDNGTFSRKFIEMEMMWVGKDEIPTNLVQEKTVRKIRKVLSYNLASKIKGKPGVLMRVYSCVCDKCQSGKILQCEVETNGVYQCFTLEKRQGKREATDGEDELHHEDEDEIDEEFYYDSEVDDSEVDDEDSLENEDEEAFESKILVPNELINGQFVLYKWDDKQFYVGTVADIVTSMVGSEVTVNLMKKYMVVGKKVHFVWSPLPHTVVIDDLLTSKCLSSMPDPEIDRRGSIMIYDGTAFVTTKLDYIY